MSLASIKTNTEQYILDNWTETPIFWDTQPVAGTDAILVKFSQVDRDVYGLGDGSGSGRKIDYTAMAIFFYGSNTLKALQYIDSMNTLLECYEFDNTIYSVGKPDGSGGLDLDNGVVEMKINYNSQTFN